VTDREERELREACFKFVPSAQHEAEMEELRFGGTIVATSGCFDIIHAGHVRFLREASRLGAYLVICVNDDESVRRLKGPGRPIVHIQDRVTVLSALDVVDRILVFTEDTPKTILNVVQPTIWVKGGDYRHKDLPERAVVEKHGGVVQILPYDPGHSTTALWARLQGLEEGRDA
jgi:D-beta-D-heptose 7-phosphate kinase/D-beta-D-heptose 1-phosphate adenosyltransferase